jgi:hypothetical protein
MSTDAPLQAGGPLVVAQTPPDQRTFVKRAAAAALGVAVVAPAVGAKSAAAAGTQPAYQDDSNTFTADQRINGNLGINGPPSAALAVQGTTDWWPAFISGPKHAAAFAHDADLQGGPWDCVNVFHKGTGDGLWVNMLGGIPPGYNGSVAGNTGVNVTIPQFLDHNGTGRDGKVVNNRTGMTGVLIGTMATNDNVRSLGIQHWGNGEAIYLQNQDPGGGVPVGTGRALGIDDWSNKPTIHIGKYTAPQNQGIVAIQNHISGLPVVDALRIYSGGVQARLQTDGSLQLGTFGSTFARAHVNQDSSNIGRALALSNSNYSDGSGVQLEFGKADGYQLARIQAVFDRSATSPTNSTLSFQVRASDSLTERLRLDYRGIGFFNATPVAKPKVTGSRSRNDALASLLTALSNLGLIADSSTN